MWSKIQYILIYCWVKAHALLPLKILYMLSDILYFVIYKVVRYRVNVTRHNLSASFPHKTEAEIKNIERDFYHHFADYIIETLKLAHISLEELHKHACVMNPEVIEQLIDKGHTCFVAMMGHYGNWEWFSGSSSYFRKARIYQIYRPLNNKAFDKLFGLLRTKFGSVCIKKNDTIRDIVKIKQEKTQAIVIFLADQTPSKANLHYWTEFLHQDTPFLNGPERIAKKLNLPVLFLDTKKVTRGHYQMDIKLVTETPKETPDNYITEQYARLLEQMIKREPAFWLWTHKRWKYKHELQK